MKAFKFRSQDQFRYALDIIFNKRLHCSDWGKLNDPTEGSFYTTRESGMDFSDRVDEIIREKEGLKVCALSKIIDSHLLWAHYASGFRGLAVEIKIPDPSESEKVREVNYEGLSTHLHVDEDVDPMKAAEEALSHKYKEWAPEQEVRILHPGEWFQLEKDKPIGRVIAGHRMHAALFRGLRTICEDQNIPLCRTRIEKDGIDAEPVS